MRIYGIRRKTDSKIVFATASRTIAFHRFNNYYNKEYYKLVILERS